MKETSLFFGLDKSKFAKREIDILIFSDEANPDIAIELKYPRNGQYPEQMFSLCKDVQFMEQCRQAAFGQTYVVIFSEDYPFYGGKQEGFY